MFRKNQMKKGRKIWLGISIFFVLLGIFLFTAMSSSVIPRIHFTAPKAAYHNWDDILSHPKPITVRAYSTGIMQTSLSAIMNLEHEIAQNIEDKVIEIPVNVGLVQHKDFGAYLIDAGLDKSYVHNQHGTIRGFMVERYLGKGSQEPNTHIAAILDKEKIKLQGVWLTHLHTDHTAGIVDLPKDIPYVAGKGERYINFRFFMQSDHLAGIDALYEIDFAEGIDLPPFGKSVTSTIARSASF